MLAMWRSLFPWRRFIMRDWWAVVLWPIRRPNRVPHGALEDALARLSVLPYRLVLGDLLLRFLKWTSTSRTMIATIGMATYQRLTKRACHMPQKNMRRDLSGCMPHHHAEATSQYSEMQASNV